jgi:hypothetical protein
MRHRPDRRFSCMVEARGNLFLYILFLRGQNNQFVLCLDERSFLFVFGMFLCYSYRYTVARWRNYVDSAIDLNLIR